MVTRGGGCLLVTVLAVAASLSRGGDEDGCTVFPVTGGEGDDQGYSVVCGGNINSTKLPAFFQGDLPTKQFQQLALTDCDVDMHGPAPLLNIFNGASFQEVLIDCEQVSAIADDALLDSQETLRMLTIVNTTLLAGSPPHLHLSKLLGPHTQTIIMHENDFTTLPAIDCGGRNPENFTFIVTDSANYLQPGFWKNCSAASGQFVLESTWTETPTTLHANTFYVGEKNDSSLEILMEIPSLSSIEPGFINTDAATSEDSRIAINLQLVNSNLTDVDEDVFEKYFSMNNLDMLLWLKGSPISCNCTIAWIVRNPSYKNKMAGPTCGDGRDVHKLDPKDFAHC